MKFKIIVDLDNVLNNLNEKAIQVFNEKYHDSISEEMFTEYDFYKCMPFDKAEKFLNICFDDEVVNSLIPKKDSQWALKYFVNSGFDVYIATASNTININSKHQWIKTLFPFIEDSKIIYIQDKSILCADVMIDDKVENLTSNIHCDRICFDMPWNRNVNDEVYGIYRCSNWEEIVDVVEGLYIDMTNICKEG